MFILFCDSFHSYTDIFLETLQKFKNTSESFAQIGTSFELFPQVKDDHQILSHGTCLNSRLKKILTPIAGNLEFFEDFSSPPLSSFH